MTEFGDCCLRGYEFDDENVRDAIFPGLTTFSPVDPTEAVTDLLSNEPEEHNEEATAAEEVKM